MVSSILIIAIPLLIAFILPLLQKINKKLPSVVSFFTLGFNLIIIGQLYNQVLNNPVTVAIGGWQVPLGINLYLDSLALLTVTIINTVGLLLAIYNIRNEKQQATAKFHTLFLLIIAGASGMVMTGDIFNLFVFIEITSIAAYGLTTFGTENSFEAVFKYIIIGSIGSVLLLIAIGFTYSAAGSLNMAEIAAAAENINPSLLKIIAALFLVGIGIEAELFPLNFWVPDVYSQAPTSVTAVLSGSISAAGIYALGRIFFTLFPGPVIFSILLAVGIITLLSGELIAFQQENIKRMLAYSSIAQMGMIVTIISINTTGAITAGMFQLVNHSILKVLLFITAGLMVRAAGSNRIKDLAGMGRKMPLTAAGFTIGAMGILGVPFFNGFISKLMIVNNALAAEKYLITGLILFATLVEAGYYLKVLQQMYFSPSTKHLKEKLSCFLPVTVLIALVFLLGIYPQIITGLLNRTARALMANSDYISTVLGGM